MRLENAVEDDLFAVAAPFWKTACRSDRVAPPGTSVRLDIKRGIGGYTAWPAQPDAAARR